MTQSFSSTSTSPTQAISPESHVVAAAQQLATALKGNIPAGNETAEALTKVSELFTKIAAAKQAAAAAKEQQYRLRANPAARIYNSPSKGGRTTSKGGHTKSKGGRTPPGCFPFTGTAGQRAAFRGPAKLHLTGRGGRRRSPPPATNNTLSHPKHNARGNVCVHRHLPT